MASDNALPKSTTLAFLILQVVAVLGEVPTRETKRLSGGDRYKELMLIDLRKKKLIYTFYRNKLRGVRLTASAKKLLLAANHERFYFYLTGKTDTNTMKIEFRRRLRLHRIAQSAITMMNADVTIYRDEKPDVFNPEPYMHVIKYPSFYLSREIKELGARATSIRGSRSVGILLTKSSALVVYNMGESLMKWDYRSELRMKTLMQTLLCHERMHEQYSEDAMRGLILADSMELAYQLMHPTGDAKRHYFVLDGNYNSFHFATNDHAGEIVVRLLSNNELHNMLYSVLSGDLRPRNPTGVFENDGFDENGEAVIFELTFDLPRIARFNSALMLHNCRGTIICFDFQAEVLRRYCSANVTIQTVDLNAFERRFLSEN